MHSVWASVKHNTLFRLGIAHQSWTCYNFIGFDLEHNTSNAFQVRQRGLGFSWDELEISQQVGSEQKELHFGNRFPKAEPSPPSKGHQSSGGPSSSFQKTLWKREREREWLLYLRSTVPRERNAFRPAAIPGMKLYGSVQIAGSWCAPKRFGMMIVFLGMK